MPFTSQMDQALASATVSVPKSKPRPHAVEHTRHSTCPKWIAPPLPRVGWVLLSTATGGSTSFNFIESKEKSDAVNEGSEVWACSLWFLLLGGGLLSLL